MKTSYLFLADGFEEIEAIAPADIMRRAGMEVYTVSISDKHEVTGANGVEVKADKLISEIDSNDAEWLILPGGMPGASNLAQRRTHCRHMRIAGCSAGSAWNPARTGCHVLPDIQGRPDQMWSQIHHPKGGRVRKPRDSQWPIICHAVRILHRQHNDGQRCRIVSGRRHARITDFTIPKKLLDSALDLDQDLRAIFFLKK